MNWIELLYQYGFGGLFFLITLLSCLRWGAADPKLGTDRVALKIAVAGFFLYLLFNVSWILAVSP